MAGCRSRSHFQVARISILLLSLAGFSGALGSTSVPVFLWSNLGFFQGAQPVDYQVRSIHSFAADLFRSLHLEAPAAQQEVSSTVVTRPDVVVAIISKELQSDHLALYGADEGDASPLRVLKNAFASATTSTVLPHVARPSFVEPEDVSVANAIARAFQNSAPAGRLAVSGGCAELPTAVQLNDAEEIKAYLETRSTSEEALLLLVCLPASPLAHGVKALEKEGEVAKAILSAVAEGSRSHVVVYTSEGGRTPFLRRSLVDESSGANWTAHTDTLCDEDCHTLASLLEIIAVALVLIITLLSGLCCLAAIDTPTRFELPRET
eukprot:TRINITY_DN29592_c0_g1_i1.p1 TRINITY_DN29592_c0_g1~~TRINITY_DN29592_c0_g1_i1.p1  ORF type:complete len:322 (+),score=55.31 TRINITY_DN29592_c0_g1_i1:297-1262(+)